MVVNNNLPAASASSSYFDSTTSYIPRPIGPIGGDNGSLYLLWSGEFLRRATAAEAAAAAAMPSVHNGCTGAVLVDGLVCYVD